MLHIQYYTGTGMPENDREQKTSGRNNCDARKVTRLFLTTKFAPKMKKKILICVWNISEGH